MTQTDFTTTVWQASRAGAAYFVGVFALGFLFGMLRLLVLVPLLGELPAVLIELPLILGCAWLLCGRLVLRMSLSPQTEVRLFMGALAFVLLMLAEYGLGVLVFDYSSADYFARYGTAHEAIGLAGQLIFALIPLLQARLPA